MTVDRDRGPCR